MLLNFVSDQMVSMYRPYLVFRSVLVPQRRHDIHEKERKSAESHHAAQEVKENLDRKVWFGINHLADIAHTARGLIDHCGFLAGRINNSILLCWLFTISVKSDFYNHTIKVLCHLFF